MLDEKKLVEEITSMKEETTNIFFVGCGGSFNDLFPAHYLLR
ncbi:hypothetical protein [Tetragenococcus halophilus]|nr:hypothetical protein [Tetragenococcus halophilus]